ncbi:hypothetical protein MKX01_027773 [Papaver californicum]|nr:hypothetical protein MKX01_027773 [Papaver californicum]
MGEVVVGEKEESKINKDAVELICSVKNYDWGRIGENSQVAKLYSLNSAVSFCNHCSILKLGVTTLLWVGAHGFKSRLKLAKDNSSFAFELKDVLLTVPDITELVGSVAAELLLSVKEEDGEEKIKPLLRSIFTILMLASKDLVSEMVSKMKDRLTAESKVKQLTEKEQLVLRLEKQYPADVGVISAFFFNYVKLNPGEALYLDATEPHAYIFGECVECMATSDNVVRAGLTPKYRDVKSLCTMLTYKQGLPEILHGVPLNKYTKKYTPPFDEFEVDFCDPPKGESVMFHEVEGPSIFLFTTGDGTLRTFSLTSAAEDVLRNGLVLFVPSGTKIVISASPLTGLQLYRAGVNKRFFLSNGCT